MTHQAQVRLVVLLSLLLAVVQTGFAQAGPLNFGNNLFVTGDYVVAGAKGMTTTFSNGYAVGTITIPDANPGITGVKQVPAGAQIVDAILYWQTVEKVGVTPGGPGSGQNGYFRPLGVTGGPGAPGYSISGVNVSNNNGVSWSNGGCSGTSTGKVLQTYRTDVVGLLPQDANGNVLVNGQFEVRLPSVGNQTPLTLGATLVIIYRVITTVPGQVVPLDAVIIYEGSFAPSSNTTNMIQTIQGFYQAGNDQGGLVVSRLTHIVGGGESNKYQTVYLNSEALPSLYGKAAPAFPGYYGMWDNPTWTFPAAGLPNPIAAGSSSVTTEVAPAMSQAGCVSWGAIVVGTTVKDSDQDGILDIWKANQGYTDVGTGLQVSLADTPLNPANPPDNPKTGQKDVFIQLDYTTEQVSGSFEPSTQVLQMVHDAFIPHNIHLHFTGFNAIPEGECTEAVGAALSCAYPNQTGVTTWRGGLEYIKNYLVSNIGADCTQVPTPASCVPRFAPAQKDSYHYVVFGDSVGDATWDLADGSLTSVVASGSTVTFKTGAAFPTTGMPFNQFEGNCPNGRVSIADAITNPALNGTFCVQSFTANSFTITVPKIGTGTYTHATDPNLAVATGQAISRSGTSDLGGSVSLITLGLWGPDGQTVPVQAGTLMHELGHTFYLPHGGVYYKAASPYVPNFEANCKPNYVSVMSYMFQVDLLDKYDPVKQLFTGGLLDYSPDTLNTVTIGSLAGVNNITTGLSPTYNAIKWYAPGTQVGTPATRYCDGTPLPANPPSMVRLEGNASSITPSWTASQNIDFDPPGTPTTLHGFSDWASLDLRQIGATGSAYVLGGAFPKGGGAFPKGGGAYPKGGGDFPSGGGAYPKGGGAYPRGGGLSGGDINHQVANSVTRSPRNLTASEAASSRNITLNWSAPTFGQIGQYNIYRSTDGGNTFPLLMSIYGNPPATTYTDTTASCNTPNGYQYFVSAVLSGTSQESVPSNTALVTANNNKMTGCYTNTPPTITLNNLAFSPASPFVQGNIVTVTWTLQVDNTSDYASPYVTNLAANSLVAVGPVGANGCTTTTLGRNQLLTNGTPVSGAGTFTQVGNVFTFQWNTDPYCAGSYTFELDLDSGQKETSSALQLNIDVNDQDNPNITTVALPASTVGVAYPAYTLTEEGGVAPFKWTVSGLPNVPAPGIAQTSQFSPTFSGMTCVANTYSVGASVTDSKGNTGSQAFSLAIAKATTTTSVGSNFNPSVFQQPVTFTVTVTPQSGCVPTGTVTLYDGLNSIASAALPANGTVTFALPLTTYNPLVGIHSMTAQYSGDSNFTASTSAAYQQTVNPALTTIVVNSILTNTLSPSTVFVGQPVTVSYTVSVQPPAAALPIAPTGNISVVASDGSGCSVGLLMPCVLSPAPKAAGNVTFPITYSGDSNFATSLATGNNYNVYQLVFTTQPSNTAPGATITPAVVVTAEDGNNNTINYTGGVTVAIGSGPATATLSGTIPQTAIAGVATFNDLSINQVGIGYTLTAAPAGGVPDATSNPFNIDTSTFYVDGSYNFGTLDLATGATTQISSGTLTGASGLDLAPGGQVFEYNTNNQLMQISTSTGAATLVGTGTFPNPSFTTTGALTNGAYYGIDGQTGSVYSINLTTGATTLVFTPSITLIPYGCNFETSLSGSGSVLYYTVGVFIPPVNPAPGGNPPYPPCTIPNNINDTLFVIDPVNQTTTAGVQLSGNGFAGSAYVGGTLYGFTYNPAQEYIINTTTGAATPGPATTVAIFGAGSSQ